MREEREKNNLLKSIERLQNEKRQPVLFFTSEKNRDITAGSQNIKTKLLAMIGCEGSCPRDGQATQHCQDCPNLELGLWEENLELDQRAISRIEDPVRLDLLDDRNIEEHVKKLPCPLECMRYDQLATYFTEQVKLENLEMEGKKSAYWADPDNEPTFWPQTHPPFPWTSMVKGPTNQGKFTYTGPNDLSWFMREAIKLRLENKNLSYKEHVRPLGSLPLNEQNRIKKRQKKQNKCHLQNREEEDFATEEYPESNEDDWEQEDVHENVLENVLEEEVTERRTAEELDNRSDNSIFNQTLEDDIEVEEDAGAQPSDETFSSLDLSIDSLTLDEGAGEDQSSLDARGAHETEENHSNLETREDNEAVENESTLEARGANEAFEDQSNSEAEGAFENISKNSRPVRSNRGEKRCGMCTENCSHNLQGFEVKCWKCKNVFQSVQVNINEILCTQLSFLFQTNLLTCSKCNSNMCFVCKKVGKNYTNDTFYALSGPPCPPMGTLLWDRWSAKWRPELPFNF